LNPAGLSTLAMWAVPGRGEVLPGIDLADWVAACVAEAGLAFDAGDLLVVAQKVVSKAEGRLRVLDDVEPSPQACELAARTHKDARLVQCVLDESSEVMRAVPGVLIVRHRSGVVHANAGVDESNVPPDAQGRACALLLPLNADHSASALRAALRARTGADVAVIVSDSGGRAWRQGAIGFALGCAGFEALEDWVGAPDRQGRALQHTQVAVADQLAAGASFLMGEAEQGTPLVLVRGARLRAERREGQGAQSLLRPLSQDLFR
jgi:coenzyme F420-0:L-glutamate ligase / coenzyme F420-1:gamma-L-glutamate ligase